MGSFANTLFSTLMGWMQSVTSVIWSLFTNAKGQGVLRWIGEHWLLLAAILCMIGLIADLGVYLVRWRPYLVWKRLLGRRRGEEEAETPEILPEEQPVRPREPAAVSVRVPIQAERKGQAQSAPMHPEEEAEDELGRWKTEAEPPREEAPAAPPLVTAAGYVVPEDSPYRRPAAKQKRPDPAAETENYEEDQSTRIPSSRHRKRLNVNDLFNSPEEEIYEFDAPQNLIDRNKAYRQPVYPRGWNREKEKEE